MIAYIVLSMLFEAIRPFGVVVSDYSLTELDEPDVQARLVDAWHAADGLLVLRGLMLKPSELVAVGKVFGAVENMIETRMRPNAIMDEQPEIFLVHNKDFTRKPGGRPEGGDHEVQYPQRGGWHSDQSYRSPPPDASLLYCAAPAVPGQGDTLFCDNARAYDELDDATRLKVESMLMLHSASTMGRTEAAVRRNPGVGDPPQGERQKYLAPVAQPVVRVHPVTGRRALYLGTSGQSDWLDGPVVGMEPGPDGAGGDFLREMIHFATAPERVVRHHWQAGDAVLYDNRVLMHSATWFDAELARREMWRLTIHTPAGPGTGFDTTKRPSWEVDRSKL